MISLSLVTVFVTVTLSAEVVLFELLVANKIITSNITPPRTQAHGSMYHTFSVEVAEVDVVVVATVAELSWANTITELRNDRANKKSFEL